MCSNFEKRGNVFNLAAEERNDATIGRISTYSVGLPHIGGGLCTDYSESGRHRFVGKQESCEVAGVGDCAVDVSGGGRSPLSFFRAEHKK